jgi:hypothetical protein
MARATKTTRNAGTKAGRRETRAGKWDEAKERRQFREVLRARLNEVLDASNVPERGRGSFVALVTHRSKQATALWLNPKSGGLPDVIALRQIALAFNLDPAYLLGISKVPRRQGQSGNVDDVTAQARAEWLDGIDEELKRRSEKLLSFVMDSDEMEPTIGRGALVFVNPESASASSSGLHAIESAGRITVRMVEARLGGGLVIRCDNPHYSEQLAVAKEAELKRHSVRIVGRVEGWLDAHWR